MLPTPHLRFVERPSGGGPFLTKQVLQQWWHKPGWTKVGDPESGEWRDVETVSAESALPVAGGEKSLNTDTPRESVSEAELTKAVQERYDAEAGKNSQRLLDAMDDKAGETKMTVEDSEGKQNR